MLVVCKISFLLVWQPNNCFDMKHNSENKGKLMVTTTVSVSDVVHGLSPEYCASVCPGEVTRCGLHWVSPVVSSEGGHMVTCVSADQGDHSASADQDVTITPPQSQARIIETGMAEIVGTFQYIRVKLSINIIALESHTSLVPLMSSLSLLSLISGPCHWWRGVPWSGLRCLPSPGGSDLLVPGQAQWVWADQGAAPLRGLMPEHGQGQYPVALRAGLQQHWDTLPHLSERTLHQEIQ